ncbi:MAG: excisionase family DNA-binding protein [Candidatus Dadabacteria bacterium]|nr:excisionase family DNA-binding protein [Candidatus Dadabacteria bacterium]
MNEESIYTVEEIAQELRTSVDIIYRRIKEGKLEAIEVGPRTYRIRESAYKKFVDSHTVGKERRHSTQG